MVQKKKFCLKNILKGGLPCPNAKITWIVPHSDCLTTPCDSCTDECIEITLLDDCDINCVHVRIECPDCDSCPPETHKICFCNNDGDCDICETCSDAGVCVEKCEHCDPITGQCGECSDNDDCPGDLECIQGKCQCPPGTTQDGNICRECSEDGECGPCKVCTEDGKCVPKDCGSGVCDPNTGECVGCANSGHCGPNEVCVDGECECAPGYVYDPINGCVPAPPCETDADCGDCMKCTEDGCVPRECPDGYICYGDDCVKLCNCDEPSCDKANHGCQRISSDLCACLPCEDGGDCDEIPCEDGTDCPDGYGCQGGVCVPCDSLDCSTAECDDVLGCECLSTRCVDADNKCNGTCSGPEDCGEGCGCYHGKCVACDNFDCEDCADVPGCACNESTGRCEDDGLDCSDRFEINKRDDNCAIEGILVTDKGCQCDRLSMGVKVQSTTPSNQFLRGINFLVELRKGDADEEGILNIPLLSQTGIANELPLSGNLRVRVIEKKRSSSYTTPVSEDVVFSQVFSLAGIDQLETGMLNFNPPGFTKQDPVTGETVTVGEVEVEFILNRKTLNFENSCSYSEEDAVVRYRITSTGGNGFIKYSQISGGTNSFRKHKVLESASNRNPIFSWYKSTTQGNETKFRSAYATEESPGYFRDGWISVAEGVEIGKFYRLESDCACDESVFYTCPESGAISKLRYCNPNNLTQRLVYTLADCNKTINLNASSNTFNVCQSNSVGGQVYELHLNGQKVAEFTASNGQIVFSGSHTISTSITEIAIKLKDYTCDDCYEPIELTPAELSVESVGYDCETNALSFSVSGGSGNYSLTVDEIPTSMSEPIELKKGEHALVFTDNSTGCFVEQSISVDCCANFQVNASNITSCYSSDIAVDFEILNGVGPYKYVIANEFGPIKEDVTELTQVSTTISNQPNGQYAVKVTDSRNCESIGAFQISKSAVPGISIGNIEYCSGSSSIEFSASLSGGELFKYEIRQGSGVVAFGDTASQIAETLIITSSNAYTLVVENENGCETQQNFSLVSVNCPSPVLTIEPLTGCEGKPLTIVGNVSGGTPPYQWSVSQAGTSLGSGEGHQIIVETGTAFTGSQGTVDFDVLVSDANSQTASQTYTFTILDSTDSSCIECGEPVPLSIDFTMGGQTVELGQAVQMKAVGGDGTNSKYVWLHDGEEVWTGQLFIPPHSEVGNETYQVRYGEDPCYSYSNIQTITVSEEGCDCTPTIKVISGSPALNGKNVTSFNQSQAGEICIGNGNTITLQAIFSSGCSGTQTHTWTVRRKIGMFTVQSYVQNGGANLVYQVTDVGDLTIDLNAEDGTACSKNAVAFKANLISCPQISDFYVNLAGLSNVCKIDAATYSGKIIVTADKIHDYLNCDASCYDTFPFSYTVKRGSSILASGTRSGGWSGSGTNVVPVTLNLSSYDGIITLVTSVKRMDKNDTETSSDNINVRSNSDPYCDPCAGRTVTANITQGDSVNIQTGESITLSGSGSSPAGGLSYKWQKVGVSTVISTSSSFSVSPTETATYRLTVTDVDGCEGNDTIQVNVAPPCPPVGGTLTVPDEECTGEDAVINFTASGGTGRLFVNGVQVASTNTSSSHTITMAQQPVSVRLHVTNDCGQEHTITKTISLETGCDCHMTGINKISGPVFLCPGGSATYTAVPYGDDTGYTYTWYVDNVQKQSGPSATYSFTKTGSATENIKVEASKNSCDTKTFSLNVQFGMGNSGIWHLNQTTGNVVARLDFKGNPNSCYSYTDVANINSFIVTADGYGNIDATSSAVALPGNSSYPILIETTFNLPGYVPSQGSPNMTAAVSFTFNDGVSYSGTIAVYYN